MHIIRKYISISTGLVKVNGKTVFSYETDEGYKKFIRAVYKNFGTNYPKFFKMDPLSKLGFMAVDILLKDLEQDISGNKTACILTNASSSLEVDEKHQQSISERENYFPSPSNFVYTLPNIMAGEAAIRHKFRGENTVLITDGFDPELICQITNLAIEKGGAERCICGWVEQYDNNYESLLFLVERSKMESREEIAEDVIFEPSILLNKYKQDI